MQRHYFLKGLALNFSNYVGYTDYKNALFKVTKMQYDVFKELEELPHFHTYFYNQDLKISLYKENNEFFILVEKIDSKELDFTNTYRDNINVILEEIGTNIFNNYRGINV